MTIPIQVQPNISQDLSNQLSISTILFNLMLDIAKKRKKKMKDLVFLFRMI